MAKRPDTPTLLAQLDELVQLKDELDALMWELQREIRNVKAVLRQRGAFTAAQEFGDHRVEMTPAERLRARRVVQEVVEGLRSAGDYDED